MSARDAGQLNSWVVDALRTPEIATKFAQVGLEPTALDLNGAHRAVAERLRIVDAMRLAVFGRAR